MSYRIYESSESALRIRCSALKYSIFHESNESALRIRSSALKYSIYTKTANRHCEHVVQLWNIISQLFLDEKLSNTELNEFFIQIWLKFDVICGVTIKVTSSPVDLDEIIIQILFWSLFHPEITHSKVPIWHQTALLYEWPIKTKTIHELCRRYRVLTTQPDSAPWKSNLLHAKRWLWPLCHRETYS